MSILRRKRELSPQAVQVRDYLQDNPPQTPGEVMAALGIDEPRRIGDAFRELGPRLMLRANPDSTQRTGVWDSLTLQQQEQYTDIIDKLRTNDMTPDAATASTRDVIGKEKAVLLMQGGLQVTLWDKLDRPERVVYYARKIRHYPYGWCAGWPAPLHGGGG